MLALSYKETTNHTNTRSKVSYKPGTGFEFPASGNLWKDVFVRNHNFMFFWLRKWEWVTWPLYTSPNRLALGFELPAPRNLGRSVLVKNQILLFLWSPQKNRQREREKFLSARPSLQSRELPSHIRNTSRTLFTTLGEISNINFEKNHFWCCFDPENRISTDAPSSRVSHWKAASIDFSVSGKHLCIFEKLEFWCFFDPDSAGLPRDPTQLDC